jgi:hypothetical protein
MEVRSVGAPILQAASFTPPALSPEEMVAIAAARPAVLQQQSVALATMHSGTTGQGTPAIDSNGHIDVLA